MIASEKNPDTYTKNERKMLEKDIKHLAKVINKRKMKADNIKYTVEIKNEGFLFHKNIRAVIIYIDEIHPYARHELVRAVYDKTDLVRCVRFLNEIEYVTNKESENKLIDLDESERVIRYFYNVSEKELKALYPIMYKTMNSYWC